MFRNVLTGRPTRAVMAVAMLAGVLVVGSFGSTPSGAVPVTKTLTGTCSGSDDASAGLLAAFGGSLTVPFQVTSDVPPTLQPEESGSPISFTWTVTLDTKVVDTVVGIDPTLDVSNLVLDMGVSGPTATTEVQGRPGPIQLALAAGQPASLQQGPFTGTLEDVGKGGVIRYTPKSVSFTIGLDLNGQRRDINVACAAAGVAATTTVKIPGSPDIVQPIALDAQPGETVVVDVLGQYVTAGTDLEGNVLPVDPTTLKVVDGPATITNGQLAITAGGPGTTTSAVFEVCSGVLPGVNETQRLVIDPSNHAMRRSVGFSLTYGEEETDTIWLARKWKEFPEEGGSLLGNLFNAIFVGLLDEYRDDLDTNGDGTADYPETYPTPGNWRDESFAYFFTDRFEPTPELIQDALEALPGIGEGGVEVTAVDGEPFSFDITFVGPNAETDVDPIAVGRYHSILPRETLELILAQAQALLDDGDDDGGPTIPDGLTLQEYADQLRDELNAAVAIGDFTTAQAKLTELVGILPDLLISNIDVDGIINFITGLFPAPPTVTTTVAGEEPTPICSQGVVDVNAAAVAAAVLEPGGPAGTEVAGRIAFAG